MDFLAIQLLNGIAYGTLLFLIAAGLSLIFGLMNVVSLAHGSFFMVGAFLGLTVFGLTGNFWAALAVAPIGVAALGILVERFFLRPLYKRGHMDQVLLTFGLTFVFLDVVQSIWGRTLRSLPAPEVLQGVVETWVGIVSSYRLFLIALGFLLAFFMWLFLERSRIGAMVRAGVDDSAMAAGLGANIPKLFTIVFGVGSALAGLGGVAAGPIIGLYPGMDAEILIPAFIVIVIGGMGSLRGAFVGSLLIGVADTLGKAYLPHLALFLIYFLMALVLLVRPQGIFGIVHSHGSPVPSPATLGMTSGRVRSLGFVALAVLALFPALASDYPRQLAAEIFVFAILAMSLNLLLGFTGLMSLGHAAFFGLGAYSVVTLATHLGVSAWIGVGVGILVAAGSAALIGFLCVRTSGITFLMLTLAFSQLVYSVALKWRSLTGGSDGLAMAERPTFFGFSLSSSLTMYFMTLAMFLCCYFFLRRLLGSPLGHVLVGIRENEARMAAIGYQTRLYKLIAFVIGGGLAGFAGGIYGIFNSFVSPDALYWTASGDILIMVILGGVGTLIGPVFGAGIFLLMKNVVSSYSEHWLLIIGVVFIACVMYFPAGISGAAQQMNWRGKLTRKQPA